MTGRLQRLSLCLLLLPFVAQATRTADAQATNGAPQQAQGGAAVQPPPYRNYSPPRYKGATLRSFYVPMSDGVRIAVDLALPEGLPAGTKIPAVVQLTRYWRARAGQTEANETQRFFTSYGYAFVTADVRGTGASFGAWTTPWSREEIRDGGEIVEWIVRQDWSNGRVGAVGNSYLGTTAQLLAVPNHPAVKAVIPRHYEFDVYTDIAFPGGVFNEWMVRNWDEANHQLDLQPGVKPVDEDRDGSLLRQALKQHAQNIDLYKAAQSVTFRDDRPFNNTSVDDFSVHSFRREIERSRVAINNWGGWMDAGTADGVIRSFATFSNPQRSVIGPWNHGASQNASPYAAGPAPGVMQRLEWLRFFDQHLKGVDTGLDAEKTLYYYTMELKGRVGLDGRGAYAVEAVTDEGRRVLLYFDAETFLLVRRDVEANDPSSAQPVTVTRYDDFRVVDGVKIPFRVRNFMTDAGIENVLAFEEARHNVAIPDAKFDKPGSH